MPAAQQGEGRAAGGALAARAVRDPLGQVAGTCWAKHIGTSPSAWLPSQPDPLRQDGAGSAPASHPAPEPRHLGSPLPALRSLAASAGLEHSGQSATRGASVTQESPSFSSVGTRVVVQPSWSWAGTFFSSLGLWPCLTRDGQWAGQRGAVPHVPGDYSLLSLCSSEGSACEHTILKTVFKMLLMSLAKFVWS